MFSGSRNLLAMGNLVSERVISVDELAMQGRYLGTEPTLSPNTAPTVYETGAVAPTMEYVSQGGLVEYVQPGVEYVTQGGVTYEYAAPEGAVEYMTQPIEYITQPGVEYVTGYGA